MSRKRRLEPTTPVVTRSAAMAETERILRQVSNKDVPVTLVGESGTGKEVLARQLHEMSHRASGPFVPINCAAIPEALFESELFGHERGAFTGAHERARGKIEAASQGTLFLDEIGELSLPMQAKLLRFIENRRFMRVGGSVKVNADVRVVSATLRPLHEDVRSGRFRADLFYRIQGILVQVPPLRERRADLLPLFRALLVELSAKHQVKMPSLTRPAKAALLAHDWPGNVRELRNVAENLCLLRAGRRVSPQHLPPSLNAGSSPPTPTQLEPTLTVDISAGLDAAISRIMAHALAVEAGNTRLAAKRLDVSVRTVQRYAARGLPSVKAQNPPLAKKPTAQRR